MKSFILVLFTLAINSILVLSNQIDNLLDTMIDIQQIYDLYNDPEIKDDYIKSYLSDGFKFIVNSVAISPGNNMNASEIRDELYDKLDIRINEVVKYNSNNTLEARGNCDLWDGLKCIIYEAGIEACLVAGAATAGMLTPAVAMCVGGLGAQALWCFSNCM